MRSFGLFLPLACRTSSRATYSWFNKRRNVSFAIVPSLRVVVVRPRFPENIGMIARACANMGVTDLRLVCPELWRRDKAVPLATGGGREVLDNAVFAGSLQETVADCGLVVGTSARLGGWRKKFLSPAQAGKAIRECTTQGGMAALVFGSERNGLDNSQIAMCSFIAHIPTSSLATSLNIAQAVLLMLYEYQRSADSGDAEGCFKIPGPPAINAGELCRLETEFMKVLQTLDCISGQDPAYYFRQWHELLVRANLRRSDYNAFMGLLRQIVNKVAK